MKNIRAVSAILATAALGALLGVSCATTTSPAPVMSRPARPAIYISGYVFVPPAWWSSVSVDLPASLITQDEVWLYVTILYGADTGTASTWREALKTWALAAQRLDFLPVFIAHCYKAGGQNAEAARVYADLYALADKQGSERDWYRVYLAHNAGESYLLVGDRQSAKLWHARAAEYLGHSDSALAHYAALSAGRLEGLD